MDELSENLNERKIGCIINDEVLNHLIYADDIIIFCPSLSGLQSLLNICENYINSVKLSLNVGKTKCIMFSKSRHYRPPTASVKINGMCIEYVSEYKYLGYVVTHNNSDIRHTEGLYRGICVRANAIFRNFYNCSVEVKQLLFKSFFTPFYCISILINVNMSDLNRLRVCYNNSIRKLFNLGTRSSISTACVHLGIPTFGELRRKAVNSLMARLKNSLNVIVKNFTDVNYLPTTVIYSKWSAIVY